MGDIIVFGHVEPLVHMAGFRHRYIIVKIQSEACNEAVVDGLKSLLYTSLKTNFGDFVLGMIEVMEVIERYDALHVGIIRCNLAIYKYICHTICSIGKANDSRVKFSILAVSGILKKAKKKMIEIERRLE